MKILALTNQYPRPGRELMAAFNRQQFVELAALHELRLVVPVPWPERLKAAARFRPIPRYYRHENGVEVEHPTYYYLPKVRPDWFGQAYFLSVGQAVRQAAREFQPDVILACWAHPDGWAAVKLGRELGLPVFLKVIGSDLLVAVRHARRRKRIVEALRAADGVVAVSHDLAEQAVRLGAAPEAVSVVHNGVDTELFSPGDRAAARERLGIVAGTLRVPSQCSVAGTLRVPSQSSVAGTLRVPSQSSGEERQGYGTRSVPATLNDTDTKIVLFVGNILLSKGAGVLVEAFAKMVGEESPKSKVESPVEKAEGRRQKAEGKAEIENCKLQIANCKLTDGRAGGIRSMPATFPHPSPLPEGEEITADHDEQGLHHAERDGYDTRSLSPAPSPKSQAPSPKPPAPSPQPLTPGAVRCYLVGSGRDERKIRALIDRYGLGDCVKLVGACPQARLVDWYRAADVVTLPSFSEGIPNVLCEALACGRPFVATRVGGIPEIADPSFSRLVTPGDAGELADALAAMLADPPAVDASLVAAQTISWRRSAELLTEAMDRAQGTGHREQEAKQELGVRS